MTNIPQTLTVSDARANLYDIINEVSQKLRHFSITHKGQTKAVIIPAEELESWEETLEILSNKRLYCQILRSQREIQQGKTIPSSTLTRKLGL